MPICDLIDRALALGLIQRSYYPSTNATVYWSAWEKGPIWLFEGEKSMTRVIKKRGDSVLFPSRWGEGMRRDLRLRVTTEALRVVWWHFENRFRTGDGKAGAIRASEDEDAIEYRIADGGDPDDYMSFSVEKTHPVFSRPMAEKLAERLDDATLSLLSRQVCLERRVTIGSLRSYCDVRGVKLIDPNQPIAGLSFRGWAVPTEVHSVEDMMAFFGTFSADQKQDALIHPKAALLRTIWDVVAMSPDKVSPIKALIPRLEELSEERSCFVEERIHLTSMILRAMAMKIIRCIVHPEGTAYEYYFSPHPDDAELYDSSESRLVHAWRMVQEMSQEAVATMGRRIEEMEAKIAAYCTRNKPRRMSFPMLERVTNIVRGWEIDQKANGHYRSPRQRRQDADQKSRKLVAKVVVSESESESSEDEQENETEFSGMTWDQLVEIAQRRGVPIGPVGDLPDEHRCDLLVERLRSRKNRCRAVLDNVKTLDKVPHSPINPYPFPSQTSSTTDAAPEEDEEAETPGNDSDFPDAEESVAASDVVVRERIKTQILEARQKGLYEIKTTEYISPTLLVYLVGKNFSLKTVEGGDAQICWRPQI